MKTVVHLVKSAKKAKLITEKCASFIFKQFAQWIPIKEQDVCGPNIETEACCFPDEICEDMTAGNCIEIEGAPQGIGTDCNTVSCCTIETVACCLLNDICEGMTPEDCHAERGVPMPSGSNCDTVDCDSSY